MFQESFDVCEPPRPRSRPGSPRGGGGPTSRSSAGEIAVAEVIEGSSDLHLGGLGVGFTRVAPRLGPRQGAPRRPPGRAIDDYLGQRPLVAWTPHTLVERREIKDDLRTVRETGLALDLEEVA